ncbi:MAG: hypothetical protein M0D53_05875 [Flavobacterium sp. JAD_PAG50586_2]|nr:MAG: hypothetical protein M0D53_05875 [Flavobacterium sp. JAD_PAG50586_2]
MAKYRISGVWKDNKNDVTAYAIHQIFEGITGRAEKKQGTGDISFRDTRRNCHNLDMELLNS